MAVFKDGLDLCKPKIVLLLLLTALAGMVLAGLTLEAIGVLAGGLAGIGFCAASAAVINHLLERDTDSVMTRTRNRPLPGRRIRPDQAWWLAGVLAAIGTGLLLWLTNWLCAILTLASLIGYAAVYTAVLKPATPYNIVIGGLPGAAPPLLGWIAVTGQVDALPLLLVALVFAWTPAHFWALALHRLEDYRRAGIPMLPVTHGEEYTRLQILLYALLTLAISLMLFATAGAGLLYLGAALLLGGLFVGQAVLLMLRPTRRRALELFHLSNLYLLLLFAALTADYLLAGPAPQGLPLELIRA